MNNQKNTWEELLSRNGEVETEHHFLLHYTTYLQIWRSQICVRKLEIHVSKGSNQRYNKVDLKDDAKKKLKIKSTVNDIASP